MAPLWFQPTYSTRKGLLFVSSYVTMMSLSSWLSVHVQAEFAFPCLSCLAYCPLRGVSTHVHTMLGWLPNHQSIMLQSKQKHATSSHYVRVCVFLCAEFVQPASTRRVCSISVKFTITIANSSLVTHWLIAVAAESAPDSDCSLTAGFEHSCFVTILCFLAAFEQHPPRSLLGSNSPNGLGISSPLQSRRICFHLIIDNCAIKSDLYMVLNCPLVIFGVSLDP